MCSRSPVAPMLLIEDSKTRIQHSVGHIEPDTQHHRENPDDGKRAHHHWQILSLDRSEKKAPDARPRNGRLNHTSPVSRYGKETARRVNTVSTALRPT